MKKCPHCGYITSNCFEDVTDCPLCNEKLVDEQQTINLKEENDKIVKRIDEIDDEIFKTMSNLYIREMQETCPERVWDNIMKVQDMDKLIFNLEWYLEALFKYEKENSK